MGKNDFKNLRLIEKMVARGEEFFLIRAFEQRSGEWRKEVSYRREGLDELMVSKRLVELREIGREGVEVRTAIEILRPKLNLIVFGAGHVGQAVALIGTTLGYDVVLVDDRQEFASRKRVPDFRVKLIVRGYSEAVKDLNIGPNSAIVIVTRGHQFDEVCLRNVIRSKVGYLGMIGSKRRTISIINRLKNDGFSDIDFSTLHAPIGLPIGAKSPQEIAVAIHAEIVSHFNLSK
jgi:xanthine dehydrogenase accessory factor